MLTIVKPICFAPTSAASITGFPSSMWRVMFSVTTIASSTFTLQAPNAAFLDILADTNLLQVMPTEAEGKFDPAKVMIGSGPWVFDSYKAGEKFVFKKNPDWYEKGYPLMDGVEVAVIPEYANRKAQFLAGNLHETDLNAAATSFAAPAWPRPAWIASPATIWACWPP